MVDHVLTPLADLLAAWLPAAVIDAAEDQLKNVYEDDSLSALVWKDGQIVSRHHILIFSGGTDPDSGGADPGSAGADGDGRPLALDLPVIPGTSLRIGSDAGVVEFDALLSANPVRVSIESVPLTLHLPPDILQAWRPVDGGGGTSGRWERNDALEGYDFTLTTGVEASLDGGFSFTETDLTGSGPAMIGNTGVLLEVADPKILTGKLPEGFPYSVLTTPKGFYLASAEARYVRDGVTNLLPVGVKNLFVASGGAWGEFTCGAIDYRDRILSERELEGAPGPGGAPTFPPLPEGMVRFDLFGMPAVLQYGSIKFEQSVPVASELTGYIKLPLAGRWQQFKAAISGSDGSFLFLVGGLEDQPVINLDLDWIRIEADHIGYEMRHGEHFAVIDGRVIPTVGGIDWPAFRVERLAVSADGDIELDGGWIDVPEEPTIDFHGFALTIAQVGFGTEGEGADRRRWLGISGTIKLVDDLPLSASVSGLRFSWPERDPGRLRVTLDGVEVHLVIPELLKLDGLINYEPPDEARSSDALSGHIFKGHVQVDLYPLRMQIGGDLMVGHVEDGGRTIPVFFLALEADLPQPIAIGASGAGLYRLSGLFGMNAAPARGTESWFEWYRADRGAGLLASSTASAGDGTAYEIATVKKWRAEPDNWAFGAGAMIGSQFDDGTVLHVNCLVLVLIPGPVILIEGRADFLKEMPEDKRSEGALQALAVIDGRADTFSLDVAARYSLSKIIDASGTLSAFFSLAEPHRWHVHLGVRDGPQIEAKLVEIFSVQSYVMVDETAIALGATAGYHFKKRLGPVRLTLEAELGADAALFWKPVQLEGGIGLLGNLGLSAFGIGFGLLLDLALQGRAPAPYWVHGEARVALTLPWPLPDLDVDVEFTWEEERTPAPVAPLLTGARMVHDKAPEASWKLSEDRGAPTLVPVDSVPILSFARPLQNVSFQRRSSGELVPLTAPDRVGDWEFSYRCTAVRLFEIADSGADGPLVKEFPVAVSASDLSGVTGFDQRPEAILPVADAQEPNWRLWSYNALGQRQIRWLETLPAHTPLCPRPVAAAELCVDWRNVAAGTEYPPAFARGTLRFVAAVTTGTRLSVRDGNLLVATAGGATARLDIRFPRPVGAVRIACDSRAIVTGYRRGTAKFSLGGGPDVRWSSPDPRDSGVDAIELAMRPSTAQAQPMIVTRICIVALADILDAGAASERAARSPTATDERQLALRPNRRYRLEVETQTVRRRLDGSDEDAGPLNTKTYHLRAGVGPGLNEASVAFAGGPADRLANYIRATYPTHGQKPVYSGYDLGVAFNEAYVGELYAEPLRIEVFDRNGRRIDDRAATTSRRERRTKNSARLTYLAERRRGGCATGRELADEFTLSRPAPAGLAADRWYEARVVTAYAGTDRVLHRFAFVTSRFTTLEEHLGSGMVTRTDARPPPPQQIVHHAVGIAVRVPRLADVEGLRAALARARTSLADAIRGTDFSRIDDLGREAEVAFDALHQANAALFEEITAPLRALPKPILPLVKNRPHRIELIACAGGGRPESCLFVVSPEPIDWRCIRLFDHAASAELVVVWNEDRSLAVLLHADGSGFAAGPQSLAFRYDPVSCPEVQALQRSGRVVATFDVPLVFELAA
jgi:hypothetical protein